MLGGFWLINEVESEFPGGRMNALFQIGYDPQKKSFVATWADTTGHYLWHYTGKLSDDGKTLVLEAEGPNFLTGEGTTKFRDSFTIESPDKISTKSEFQIAGNYVVMATGELTRAE